MIYLASIFVSFVSVFLKGFQHKNVIGHHVKSAILTSYFMATFDMLAISLVIKGGWPIALSAGTGGTLGIIAAMYLHDYMFKKWENDVHSSTDH